MVCHAKVVFIDRLLADVDAYDRLDILAQLARERTYNGFCSALNGTQTNRLLTCTASKVQDGRLFFVEQCRIDALDGCELSMSKFYASWIIVFVYILVEELLVCGNIIMRMVIVVCVFHDK